ncbi:MAG: phosphosulfolactate synthase [Halobacteriaceae archaeon]
MQDDRFAYLVGERAGKPRERGITFVIGEAMTTGGPRGLADLLEWAGPWMDWYKFVYSGFPLQRPGLVQRKLSMLAAHDVEGFPGGNFLEIAAAEGVAERFLADVADVGFDRVEVSTTVVELDRAEKSHLIETAREEGLAVHAEVGRKPSEGADPLALDDAIAEMEADLAAGADRVVFESEAVEAAMEGESGGDEATARRAVERVTDAVGADSVVFEVPLRADYGVTTASAWLVETVGPDVNLGNVAPQHVNLVEQQRRGVGPGTY